MPPAPEPHAGPRLRINELAYAADGRVILDGISLAVRPGELTAIVGPNGAGKTTLLHLAAGAGRPGAGDVLLDGKSIRAMSRRHWAQQVALVEQEWGAVDGASVRDLVHLGRLPHRTWFGTDEHDEAIVSESLALVEAEVLAARDSRSLSGGERQRANIARALAQRPNLLLCDEPTNHLDIRAQLATLGLLRDLARAGLAVVVTLHDLNHALTFSDNVIVVADGAVRAFGSPEETLSPDIVASIWGVRPTLIAREGRRPLLVFDGETTVRQKA